MGTAPKHLKFEKCLNPLVHFFGECYFKKKNTLKICMVIRAQRPIQVSLNQIQDKYPRLRRQIFENLKVL